MKIKKYVIYVYYAVNIILRRLGLGKDYKLAQEADKDKVYGALKEFTNNPKLWRSSSVGREYCHLTDDGREVIADMMQDILRTVDALERKSIDQRAKELVIEQLKN